MPIIPKYTWEQDEDHVYIKIMAPGASPDSIRLGDVAIALNAPPYLLTIDLLATVDDSSAAIQVDKGVVSVRLNKVDSTPWAALSIAGGRQALIARRKASFDRALDRRESDRKRRLQEKVDLKTDAQKSLWKQEDDERSYLRKLKQDEEENARADVANWAESTDDVDAVVEPKIYVIEDDAVEERNQTQPNVVRIRRCPTVLTSFTSVDSRAGTVARDPNEDDEFAVAVDLKPGDSSDLTESHSVLLKEKGSGYFRSGDFLSAISAFSAALSMSPNDPGCLANRAACYLKLATLPGALAKKIPRLRKSIADCNVALSALAPGKHRPLRFKILVRRGSANALLGDFRIAISDYEEALIMGEDEDLYGDLEWMLTMARRQADSETDLEQVETIEEICGRLEADPCNVRLLVRRAQIRERIGEFEGMVDDATEALCIIEDPILGRQLLQDQANNVTADLYHMRARALFNLDRLITAEDDAKTALKLAPNDRNIQSIFTEIGARIASAPTPITSTEYDDQSRNDSVQELIDNANSSFVRGDVARARRLYCDVLRLEQIDMRTKASILSNRGACALYMKEYDSCICDCSASLELGALASGTMAATFARRASAQAAIGLSALAEADLRAAIALVDQCGDIAQQLRADLQGIQSPDQDISG